MKNKGILKFQIGGVQRDATAVNKQEKQLKIKPKSNASIFKDGGKIGCGCNMDKDGIDTDILKLLPQTIADILHSKIGVKKGVKYDDNIKNKLKEDASNKGINLREYLTENPLVSKQIIMIEKMKQGGVIKHQTGGLKTKHGMIYNAQKPLDKKVLYSEMTDMEKDIYMKRPAVKPVKTSDGYLDDEQTTNRLITTVFGNMPEEQRTQQLESFAEKHPDIAERLTMGEFNDTDVNKLKLFVDMNTKKKFQFGGLQTMLNSTESVKDIESTIKQTVNPMLRNNIPQQQMQQGGQVNEQQKFIQWLAQKLGVKSQQELQAAMQKMGKQGIQKAQQMYQQEMSGAGGQQMAKKGGMFRFQTGGKYKPTKNVSAAELKASDVIDKNSKAYKDVRDRYLKDSFRKYEDGAEMVTPEPNPQPDPKPSLYGSIPTYTTTDRFRQGFKAMNNGKTVLHTAYNDDKTKAVQLRFTAGTWDDTDPKKTNNYNNIKSSEKFDATRENAQKKLDYSGFGYRTQFGTQGNRGKQGINLTDRLAQEREQDFKRMETNPEDYLPGGKEYHRVDPKTGGLKSRDGKYILGMFESKPSEKPPGDDMSLDIDSNQEYATVIEGRRSGGASTQHPQILSKVKEAQQFTQNPKHDRNAMHGGYSDMIQRSGFRVSRMDTSNPNKPIAIYTNKDGLEIKEGDTIPVKFDKNKMPILDTSKINKPLPIPNVVAKRKGGMFNFIR